MPRARDAVDERTAQARPALLEHAHGSVDRLLLLDAQRVPPCLELVGELDVPHSSTIPRSAYTVNGIERGVLARSARHRLSCTVTPVLDKIAWAVQIHGRKRDPIADPYLPDLARWSPYARSGCAKLGTVTARRSSSSSKVTGGRKAQLPFVGVASMTASASSA